MATAVGPGKTRRTNKRIARVRLANPNALPNIKADSRYTPREVRRVKKVDARVRQRQQAKRTAGQYNPLAPLTGKREKQELNAATKLKYGPAEQELRQATANQEQTTSNRAAMYDEYRQMLREASARTTETNRQNVEAQAQRADSAYQQDSAAVAQRDAAASEAAAKLGRGPVQSNEGAQAVEAQRTAMNESVGRLREKMGSDTKFTEQRYANSGLKKIEDQGRQQSKAEKLRSEGKKLASEKGSFRVDQRRQTRNDERTYAMARKEFGLKEKDLLLKNKATSADRKLEKQKLNAQKIVARIYAGADKAGARAQIRVAQLQLDKGKISKHDFVTIKNIYEGLPEKGKGNPAANPNKKPLSATEEKTVKQAFKRLGAVSPPIRMDQKNKAISQLVGKYGYPPRVAREAWKRYSRKAPGSNYNGPH